MRRFFVDPSAVKEDRIEICDKGDLRHLARVLRMKPGDQLMVSDSSAWEYRIVLEEISGEAAVGRILDKQAFGREPSVRVTLYQAAPKQGKMELIIQKTTELGAERIVPMLTRRTLAADKGAFRNKRERWQKVADEAGKQCGRGRLPEVAGVLAFQEVLGELKTTAYDLVLFLYENEEKTTIKEALRRFSKERREKPGTGVGAGAGTGEPEKGPAVALLVGPEGGFSEEEAELLKACAVSVSLGRTVLRTETAGMAALAMVMYELEL
ncbi:MAG: RsmE family RNA methyltransferase [Bacillota bacterium]|nr:RsmE family RNA methyltransferase [Bacillota bacterium]